MCWLAYISAWFSSAVAVIGGLYFTHNPWCLLIMILPATIKMTSNTSDSEDIDN